MNKSDLSEYKIIPGLTPSFENQKILNVGWLEKGMDFKVSEPSKAFIEALRFLVSTSCVNAERSYDYCPLCLPDKPKSFKDFKFPEHEVFTNVVGEERKLGNCEVWVDGEGETYAAPNLIIHYVLYHKYQPPEKFISAVIKHYHAESNE